MLSFIKFRIARNNIIATILHLKGALDSLVPFIDVSIYKINRRITTAGTQKEASMLSESRLP